jgi:tRNA (guanine-N7-)-methyltransferase
MSRKGKLEKYSEITTFPNVVVIEETRADPSAMAEIWRDRLLQQNKPLALEVGCGTGDHTLALARRNPHITCVGLDFKGARIWQGARKALDEPVTNAFFVRMRAERLGELFPEACLDQLWITFPDPHAKMGHKSAERRLTSPRLMDIYRKILAPGAAAHLKTDDIFFFEYTLKQLDKRCGAILCAVDDLHASPFARDMAPLVTAYEARFIGEKKKIMYLKFMP